MSFVSTFISLKVLIGSFVTTFLYLFFVVSFRLALSCEIFFPSRGFCTLEYFAEVAGVLFFLICVPMGSGLKTGGFLLDVQWI